MGGWVEWADGRSPGGTGKGDMEEVDADGSMQAMPKEAVKQAARYQKAAPRCIHSIRHCHSCRDVLSSAPGWCCRGAYSALSQYTHQTIADLRADDDEMLRGVDWKAVIKAGDVQPTEHHRVGGSVGGRV